MKLSATEQIRLLLKREIYKQKDLVIELSARTGKNILKVVFRRK